MDEIDRHYGHLARDGREQATELLDSFAAFDLSRYMGASLTMIDRLAHDSRDRAINLLDAFTDPEGVDVHGVDTAWTPQSPAVAHPENATAQ